MGKYLKLGLYHHEWFDGTGYPYGLSGNEIPITARLITLVDSFDAMTTNRPYRDAMSVEDTIEEILKRSGTHFDPYLVNKFVNMDLKYEMTKISEFTRSYTDDYSVPDHKISAIKKNVNEIFNNIDPYEVLNNLSNNSIYGLVIAEYGNEGYIPNGFCSKILYKNSYFDDLIENGFFDGDSDMCYRKSINRKCGFCPVNKCVESNKKASELVKLENKNGEIKYLNTVFYPFYKNDGETTVIVGFVRDNTIEQTLSINTTKEFLAVTRSLTDLFAERDERFRRISNNMEMLATWMANKVEISMFEKDLLTKAISICDLGIIPLIDSNEYSFESIEELRHNTDHIKVIDELMMSIETFKDIKDIVLYHHALYNDTGTLLVKDQVPIQSYIIRLTDFILTDVVANEDIEETLKFVEKMSGKLFSPTVCNEVLKPDNKKELMHILSSILGLK